MNFLVLLVTFYIVKHAVSCKPEYYFEICEIYCLKLNFHETWNPLKYKLKIRISRNLRKWDPKPYVLQI